MNSATAIKKNQSVEVDPRAGKYLTFFLASEEYGVEILKVQEIIGRMPITPVPLIGWLPGFGLIVIALGLIEHDGLAVAVGLGLAVAAVLFGAGLVVSLAYADTLIHMLPHLWR